ncbi:hypothetical protein DMC63_37685 [Streptomyces sp. WAC 05977]|nr:hypothetical protein DMC63_37685 [Streptomyces sp. WAC 05977]
MHANNFTTATVDDDTRQGPIPPSRKPGWPTWAVHALARLTTARKDVQRFVMADPVGAATLLGTVVCGVLTFLLVLSTLAKIFEWLVSGHPVQDLAQQLPAVRIVTDPIGHWMAMHTAGLPLTAQAAAWLWGGTGFLLFYAACYRHLGAQLLWPIYGAATAAMAWSGTATADHRPVVVGLLAIAWSALSLLALRGRRRQRSSPVQR